MICARPTRLLPRLLPLLFPLLAAGASAADPCDELPKPTVSIKRIDEQVGTNTAYSYQSLTHIGASLARPGQQVLGLTRGNATVGFAVNAPVIVDRSGRWECASPQITLSFGFSPLTVYVAREFPEGSCAFKEILEHERRHVEAFRTHLVSIEKELGQALNARFATGSVWRGPAGQTAGRLRQELDARWAPYVQRAIKRVDAAQAKIDSAEEYARLTKACDGAVAKVLRTRS